MLHGPLFLSGLPPTDGQCALKHSTALGGEAPAHAHAVQGYERLVPGAGQGGGFGEVCRDGGASVKAGKSRWTSACARTPGRCGCSTRRVGGGGGVVWCVCVCV